jgi:hypothetical protein
MDDPSPRQHRVMTGLRAAYPGWSRLNDQMTRAVASLTEAELAETPGPDRWPLWAMVGHAACQRVFWLCDVAGEPGAADTMFPNAAWMCPGDDDLDHPLDSAMLVRALDQTFAIVERVLDSWTLESLTVMIDRSEWEPDRVHSRGFAIERVYAHDLWHAAEANEVLTRIGRPVIDPWS